MVRGNSVPVALFTLVLILRPHMAGDAFPFSQGLLLIPALAGLALLLLRASETGSVPKGIPPVLYLPWALLLWSVCALFWAPDPGQGLREVAALAGGVSVYSMAYWFMNGEGEFGKGAVPVLGLVMVPVLGSAVYQRFFGMARLRDTLREMEATGDHVADLALIISNNRVFAGFLNPNMLAGFLAVGLCLTLDLYLTAGERKRSLFFLSLTAAQGLVLVLTGSVGGTMVAVAMAGVVLFVRKEFSIKGTALAGALILIIGAGLLAIRGTGFLFGPENSLVQRVGYMAAGLNMGLVHPVLGWGSGSSPGALMGFVAEGVRPVADPHNFLVRAWISWGVPGLFLLTALLLAWLRTTYRFFRTDGLRQVPRGYAGFVFGGLAFLAHSLMDMDFFVPETALFGWCALGAAAGMAASAAEVDAGGAPRGGKGWTMALGGLALALVLPAFIYLQGESLAYRAHRASVEGEFDRAASLYREAGRLLPMNGRFALDEGRARSAAGDFSSALVLYREAESRMQASPYPPWETGRVAQAMGQWQSSIPFLETALSRYSTSPRIRIDLAKAYLNLADGGRAVTLLEEVLKVGKFDPQARELARDILSRMDR